MFANDTGNQVFCMIERAERLSNQFIENFKYWKRYYFDNKYGKEMLLQQEYGKYKANLASKEYALMANIKYKFKLRVRPDLAMVKSFPSIESFSFIENSKKCDKIIYFPSPYIFGVAAEDSFNFGEAGDMDHLLDRYLDLLTSPYRFGRIPSIPRHLWNSEGHLLGMLEKNRICLKEHGDIWIAKM